MGMFNPERNIDGIIDNGDIDGVTKDNHGGTSPTLAREESDEDLLDSPDLDELWEDPPSTLAREESDEDLLDSPDLDELWEEPSPTLAREESDEDLLDSPDLDELWEDPPSTLAREESDEDLLDSPDLDELWEEPSPTLAREESDEDLLDSPDLDELWEDPPSTLAREESDEDLLDSPDLDELWEEPSPTLARKVDYEDTVRLLLEKGADVNAKDKTGENAFDYAQDKAIVDVLKEGQTKHGPSHLKESLSDLAEKDNRESDASYTLSEEYARGNNVSFSVSNAALVRNKER